MGIINDLYGGGPNSTPILSPYQGSFQQMREARDGEVANGPSADYIARMNQQFHNNKMGMGNRPSPYHQWIPGYGWQFIAEFDPNNTIKQQFDRLQGQEREDALNNGWQYEVTPNAQAVMDQLGITVGSAPAYRGVIENAIQANAQNASRSGMLTESKDNPEWSSLNSANITQSIGPFMLGQIARRG